MKKKAEFPSHNGIGYDILKKYILGEHTWTFTIWRELVKFIGKICVFSTYMGLIIFLYSFYFDTCKLYYVVYRDIWISTAMIFFGLIISFNVVFNYTFATFLSPGNTDSFRAFSNEDYENLKMRLAVDHLNFCKKCESFKPIKTHHCSICKQCILRKDHHNAWINNCVGYHNHRYLILFLCYIKIMIVSNLAFAIPVIFQEEFISLKPIRTVVYPYVIIGSLIVLTIVITLSIWQYMLLCKGETTNEFLQRKLDKYEDMKYRSTSTFNDNIFTIFGTKWFILIFCPSIRKLPYDGINWDPNEEVAVQYLTLTKENDDSSLGVVINE